MTTIYEQLGIRTIVNAKGPSTRVSGGIMAPEVARAMGEASQACVDMAELQARASEIIAEATGAEAGLVTAGAAAGLLLGTAACMTGLDPGRMNRLPDTRGMPNRVVMVRSQRNFYDHAVRTTGARIVEVGLPDRVAGAGVRDAEPWEIADAIDARTALVHWVAGPEARPPLPEVVAVAHAAGVPVLVDAAAQLPPASNLRRFVELGADLVAFSGGKAIGGPQASGILAGRRDLIMAAALQQLDLDVAFEQWRPPPTFIDTRRLKGLPHHGIGRPCKVGKEEVAGLLMALRRFVAADADSRRARWRNTLREIQDGLPALRGATVTLLDGGEIPLLALDLEPDGGAGVMALILALEAGEPSIRPDPGAAARGRVLFNPVSLRPEDPPRIAGALGRLLGERGLLAP
ncbi:MAG TPA: aminotransferase class V-fold PLP-dependent enzyme [Geminicoccaceae bacterium]